MTNVNPKKKQVPLGKMLSIVVATVAAVAGILVNLKQIKEVLISAFPKHAPYTVEVTSPPLVPTYLKYYYSEDLGTDQSFYWMRFKLNNRSKEPLSLKVRFKLAPGCNFVTLTNQDPMQYSLEPGQSKEKTINPPLEFANANFASNCKLRVNWIIENAQADKAFTTADDAEIELLPPNVIKWDLLNPEKKVVSREFLLASLAAWSLSRHDRVMERAKKVGDADSFTPQQWMRLCYESLFRGQDSIILYPTARTYPFHDKTVLETPSQVLSSREAEPLEAAFLMASMIRAASRTGRSRLYLLILPSAEDPRHPAVLLAWLLPNTRTGGAIDLRRAKELDFNSNLIHAQALIKQLPDRQRVIDSVRERGIFIDSLADSRVAMSLDRAVERFKVRALE